MLIIILTVSVQANFIEVPATWFMPNIFVDYFRSQLLQADGVREGLAAGLHREGDTNISLYHSIEFYFHKCFGKF